MVRNTLTMWMPKSVPPTPWKVRRCTSARAHGGPGSRAAGADGGGGGGGAGGVGIRGGGAGGAMSVGGGGGGAKLRVTGTGGGADGGRDDDGGDTGLRKKLGRFSGPGDAGPAMPALS